MENNIPDDILLNIFVRLPAKQLAQMRCLSKSWNLFLSESSFIKSHLKRSIQNNHNDGVLLVFNRLFSFASKPFTPHPYRSPYLDLNNFIKLPLNNPPQSQSNNNDNRQGKVIGSVNGLICFKYGTNHHSIRLWDDPDYVIYGSDHGPPVVYIWNPSLSALLTLPPYYIPSHSIQQFFRFGFDPKTDDYKVVKVSRRLRTSPNTVSFLEWLPVEVYSMRKGSWKFITQRIPSHFKKNLFDFDRLCVDGCDGHLHWLHGNSFRGYRDSKTILAFDLGKEIFSEILFPDSVTGNNISTNLGVLAGKLCVISWVYPHNKCEVWVMEEYGVAESWVKRHVFSAISGNLYPYGFTPHNEFLFQVVGHRYHGFSKALYDPVASNTKIFKFVNWAGGKVVDYVDSLVWVTPAEQREMSCCSISQFQL